MLYRKCNTNLAHTGLRPLPMSHALKQSLYERKSESEFPHHTEYELLPLLSSCGA